MEYNEDSAVDGHVRLTALRARDGRQQETRATPPTPATPTTSTLTVHVDGLICAMCLGDVMDRVHLVPGVVQVDVGPIDAGQSWVTVTSDPGVTVTQIDRALSRGGFHIASGSASGLTHDDYEGLRQVAMAEAGRMTHYG